jgi:hypothetical protein
MTNAERRERRRQAGLKGAATRRARSAGEGAHQVEPPQLVPPVAEPPRLETPEERARRAHSAEEKRLTNLRAVLRLAQEIRREGDLYYHAHHRRWHHSPRRWTAEQIQGAREFLEKFRRPDGTYDPKPLTRKGRWRL